jgi:serine/threonine protein kinase/lipopolysaccharide biosynthesis regulator YciM
MTSEPQKGIDGLPGELLRHAEQLCRQFEAAWQAGRWPAIEDYLKGLPEPERTALMYELIQVESEYRRRAGEEAEPAEYGRRFPDLDVEWLAGAVARGRPGPGRQREGGPQAARAGAEPAVSGAGGRARRPGGGATEIEPTDPLEDPAFAALLEEFLVCARRGEGPSPEDYAARHPDLAGPIRELFPALLVLQGQRPSPAPPADSLPADSLPAALGDYEIVREIGRGGMGVVYRARDTGLDRDVAVKVLSERYPADSPAAQRFRREARITGQLQHPGIPAVHQFGTLPDGRPFLAMKLIRGTTLADILQHRTDPAADRGQLLGIFEGVCQAVGYAHAHRVLHRDLKPANVMVGAFGEVQVMDWGLAKVLGEETPAIAETLATETTRAWTEFSPTPETGSLTQAGSLVGTAAYIAPEQAAGELDKVDQRADVFGLGAILAVILTGQPPYVGDTFESVRVQAVRGKLEDCFARLDACGVEPELLALCKRCLAFEPAERPADAGAVAQAVAGLRAAADERARRAELERVRLEGEQATALARAAEQRKRRRTLLLAGGVIGVVLLVGLSVSLWQMFRAQRNLAFARKGNDILGSVFAGLDPKAEYATVADLRNALRDNLRKAVQELEGSAIGEPLEVAAMQVKLGQSLLGLGEFPLAVEVHNKALATRQAELGPDHPDTLNSMNLLAVAYLHSGQLAKAVTLQEETVEKQKAKLGPDHPDTLDSMNNLANAYQASGQLARAVTLFEETLEKRQAKLGSDHLDTIDSMNGLALAYLQSGQPAKAVTLCEETLEKRKAKLGPDHPDTLYSMNGLANAYQANGQLARAVALHEETLEKRQAKLGPDHLDTLDSMNNLANAYYTSGQLGKAVTLLEETLEKNKAKRGPDHPATLITMGTLAQAYWASGQLGKAVPLFEETLEKQKAKLGPDHPHTLVSMASLALAYYTSGQLGKAVPLLEETLEKQKAKLGPDHPETLLGMNNLAVAYQASGQLAKAVTLHEETLEKAKANLGPDHPHTLMLTANLANAYCADGQLARAVTLQEETLEKLKAKLGPDHPFTLRSMNNLAVAYWASGQLGKAVSLHEQTLEKRQAKLGRDHPDTLHSMNNLALAYQASGQLARAVTLFEQTLEKRKAKLGAESHYTLATLADLGAVLLQQHKWSEAEPLLRVCLAGRQKQMPDRWLTFDTQSLLGAALLGQKKHAEAEPPLVQGYEGMKARANTIPPAGGPERRLPEALDRLIELYTALNKPDEAKKWQAERAKYPPGKTTTSENPAKGEK